MVKVFLLSERETSFLVFGLSFRCRIAYMVWTNSSLCLDQKYIFISKCVKLYEI